MADTPEIRFTPAQAAAIGARGGSLLVSAAAGSGKTKVLVDRLFRYVTEERCNIDDFLIITYTKAAAAELRAQGKRAKTSCWYAAQWFEKHPQEQDLLYKD